MIFTALARFFLALFWIVFPFQLRTLIYTTSWYETGNFNPFTSFFIHASDGLLLVAFFCYGLALWRGEIKLPPLHTSQLIKGIVLLAAVLVPEIIMAEDKVLSSLLALRWVEWGILLYLSTQLLSSRKILQYFIAGMSIQSIIAIMQYIYQSSLGLQWLGEPIINSELLGVAKVDWGGEKLLRSYGTFPHPNVLGGALAFGIVSLCYLWQQGSTLTNKIYAKFYTIILLISSLVMALALLLTFSRSAWLALVLGLGVAGFMWIRQRSKKITKKLSLFIWPFIGLIVMAFFICFTDLGSFFLWRLNPHSDPNALNERLIYLDASFKMLWQYPLGVGEGHFTLQLPTVQNFSLNPWELQPVHNFWLIMLNELGVTGFITLMIGVGVAWKRFFQQKLLSQEKVFVMSIGMIFITISMLDHYFFTLYQGQILVVLFLLIFSKIQSENKVLMSHNIKSCS